MITLDFPQHIFIETTSLCNLKCKLCPRTSGNTLIGNMDFELFKKIIDENFKGQEPHIIATGGLSQYIATTSSLIKYVDIDLALKGLKITLNELYEE